MAFFVKNSECADTKVDKFNSSKVLFLLAHKIFIFRFLADNVVGQVGFKSYSEFNYVKVIIRGGEKKIWALFVTSRQQCDQIF